MIDWTDPAVVALYNAPFRAMTARIADLYTRAHGPLAHLLDEVQAEAWTEFGVGLCRIERVAVKWDRIPSQKRIAAMTYMFEGAGFASAKAGRLARYGDLLLASAPDEAAIEALDRVPLPDAANPTIWLDALPFEEFARRCMVRDFGQAIGIQKSTSNRTARMHAKAASWVVGEGVGGNPYNGWLGITDPEDV